MPSGKQLAVVIRRAKRREANRNRIYTGPVIAPRAVEAFRRRKLNSFSWLKQCTRRDLLDMPWRSSRFKFHTQPWLHQLACFAIAITQPEFLFFLDMGAGKSKISLDALYFRRLKDGLGKVLVVVPSAVNVLGWVDQVAEHRPEFKVVALLGSREERQALLESPGDVYVVNYDGLMSFMTSLGGEKEGRTLDYKAAEHFAKRFDAVVFDETHLVGNKASLRFRMCNALRKHIGICFGLTGTPFGRNPEKIWSQFFLVDRGATLGSTLGMYRAAFFLAKENYFGGVDYSFDERHSSLLHSMLNNRSIRYEDREFSDMPKCVYNVHRLSFATEAEEYYRKVRDELISASKAGAREELQNSFLRMRQVCAGFLTLKDTDSEEKLRVAFYTNPKLEELEVIVDGLEPNDKVIVFHEFVLTGDAICAMLDRKKVKRARVGGAKHNNSAMSMQRFLNDPQTRVLVANNKSGATTGINPQKVCRRIVFFDSPVSPIVRKQAEARVLRQGQQRHVYIHDLVIARSVDEQVLGFLKEGRDLFEAIINGEGEVL